MIANLKKKKFINSNNVSIILGLASSAIYLLIEGLIDTYILNETLVLFQDIFTTDAREILLHLVPTGLILFIGIYRQELINGQKKAEEKLRDSEEKYQLLVETSPISIILLNTKGIIVDCNKITEEIAALPKSKIIGKKNFEIYKLTGENHHKELNFFTKAMSDEFSKPFELNIVNRNGKNICLEMSISSIKIEGEIFFQIASIDISSRKKAALLIKEEIEKLHDLDKLKNNLIVRSSYEIKNPLTAICNASEILLLGYKNDLDERANELLKIINNGGKKLNKLLTKLTEISIIKSKNKRLEFKFSNITKIIHECVNELSYLVLEREQFLNLLIDETVYLYMDSLKIKQVISEIILNAIHNTPTKGMISINLQKHSDFINIIIKDTGVGFTAEENLVIFREFGKIERYGKGMDVVTDGIGMGLYFSKKIIELHGGKIWMESEGRNKGSIFIIQFPITIE